MSQAHRPTWAPAMGRESKIGSKAVFIQAINNQTKLKFRAPGQTSTSEVARRDLKAELARAEREARDRRRKEDGLPAILDEEAEQSGGPEPIKRIEGSGPLVASGEKRAAGEELDGDVEDEGARKRRKLLEALDADDDDDEDDEDGDMEAAAKKQDKGKGKASEDGPSASVAEGEADSSSDEDSDDEDEEEETRALMAELAKIKRERAEEKERIERESQATTSADRATEIATGNPLLNLAAALGQTPSHAGNGNETPRSSYGGGGTSVTGSTSTGFAVKRRWDDDLIFKNQASGVNDKPKKEFVNDLLRSEFHRKFMSKFIK